MSPCRPFPTAAAVALLVALLITTGPAAPSAGARPATYDVVIANGRVIDPETGLDGIRHVGIVGDRIAAISTGPLDGTTVIDAAGLVVSPGFIDLHAHGQSARANEFQALDGVTTALEMEGGVPEVAAFLRDREGDATVNYGATVAHMAARTAAMPEYAAAIEAMREQMEREGAPEIIESMQALQRAGYETLEPEHYGALEAELLRGLREGALGFGVPHQYYPGANHDEIFRVFEMAAKYEAPIFTHVRGMNIAAMQEVIANAAATGAPLHIVHVNSMSLWNIATVLDLIAGAQARGVDVTTEAYPYTAASTGLESSIFDDGWQERLQISYGDIQHQDTGERLTEETFRRYREEGAIVIIHMMKPEWIELAMKTPFVMVASDGMPYAPGAHPRSAGTFARFMGRYVRELELMPLIDAVAKVSTMPAKRLEAFSPQMTRKGRIQVGADADITIFDPGTILDTATFEEDLSASVGVQHVLVNGVAVVRDGELVAGARPGRAVVGRYAGH